MFPQEKRCSSFKKKYCLPLTAEEFSAIYNGSKVLPNTYKEQVLKKFEAIYCYCTLAFRGSHGKGGVRKVNTPMARIRGKNFFHSFHYRTSRIPSLYIKWFSNVWMFSSKGRCTGADCEANYVFIVREMSITIERTGKVRHSYKQPVRRQLRGFRRGAIKKLIAAKTSQHDIVQQSRVGASAEKRQGGNLSDELIYIDTDLYLYWIFYCKKKT